MVCSCGGVSRSSTWKTADGWIHYSDTCTACGLYHRWPSVHEATHKVRDADTQLDMVNAS